MKPELITVESLDGHEAADYFVPHDPQRPNNRHFETIVTDLVESGEVIAVEISYTDSLSVGWLNHHKAEIGNGTESTNHISLKLRLAKFLDELGHDCGRWSPTYEYEPELERWETEDYLYSGFETPYAFHGRVADFSCSCESHTIYCEAGRTPPKKLADADLTDSADALVVAPYSSTADGRRGEPSNTSVAVFAASTGGLRALVAGNRQETPFTGEVQERLASAFEVADGA